MMELAVKLCPANTYVYIKVYLAFILSHLAFIENWWTLKRVVVGGVSRAATGPEDFFTTFFLGTSGRYL
jgi:hypothetical protein